MRYRWLLFVPVLLLVTIAAACGDDATPVPAPTPVPVDVAAIASQVQAAVKGTVEEALKAAPTGPSPLTAAEIQSLVEAAVGAVAPEGASAADIKNLVDTALKAAITPGVTKGEVEALVSKAVADAAAAAEPGVSAMDVQKIVEKAVSAVPVARAQAVPLPAQLGTPTGTVNFGYKELPPYQPHPSLTGGNTQEFVTSSVFETLLTVDDRGAYQPKLIRRWTLAADNLTWTFHLQKGIQWHKGFGEMTAEDVMWSIEQCATAEGTICTRASHFKRLFMNEKGGMKALDPYTLEVNTGTPQYDMLIKIVSTSSGLIASKKQLDLPTPEASHEEARNAAGTGAYEFVDEETHVSWKHKAVPSHWRKTANFDELVYHEIAEEATRVANFQVGKVDTFAMAFDSIPAVEKVAGTKFMRIEGGATRHIILYGNWFGGSDYEQAFGSDGWKNRNPGYDPDLPWVSASPDFDSPEWERARKVREALAISIDRQTIVDTILRGEGQPNVMFGWGANMHRLGRAVRKFEPERAKELLKEAGAEGFKIDLLPSIRGLAGERAACEAAVQYWTEIGIKASIGPLPYEAIAPLIRSRTYNQAYCTGTSGQFDPLSPMSIVYHSQGGFNAGFHHDVFDKKIGEATAIIDTEERMKAVVEIGQFIYDNALDLGLLNSNVIWPLGPKIGDWSQHWNHQFKNGITALEWVPHR